MLSRRHVACLVNENVEGVHGRLYHMDEVGTDTRLEMLRERVQKMDKRLITLDATLSHSLTEVANSVKDASAGLQTAESWSAEVLKQQIKQGMEALETRVNNAVKEQIKEQTGVLFEKLAELMSKVDGKSPRGRRL